MSLMVPGPKGTTLICILDSEDLPLTQIIKGTWFARWQQSPKTFYVMGKCDGPIQGKRTCPWIFLHRVVANAPPHLDVDHLFHNGLDNRKKSLEIKTRSRNLLNRRGAQENSKTGILGVHWAKKKARRGKGRDKEGYVGQLRVDGKKYCSSVRHTAEEASKWYWAKREELGIPVPGTIRGTQKQLSMNQQQQLAIA